MSSIRFEGAHLERFSGLVGSIYEAASRPSQWPKVMEQVAGLHGATVANLLTPATSPKEGGFIISHGLGPEDLALWGTKYVQHDPWILAARGKDVMREGFVVLGDELLPPEEYAQSFFYRDFLSKRNLDTGMCAGIVFSDPAHRYNRPTTCTVLQGKGDAPFDERNKVLMSHTVNHLSKALGTMYRLRDSELRLAASVAALEKLAIGVVLFGVRGNVEYVNRRAMDLIAREDAVRLGAGNPLTDAIGWLEGLTPASTERLRAKIDHALANAPLDSTHFSRGLLIPARGGGRSLALQVSTLSPSMEFPLEPERRMAIGFLSEIGARIELDPGVMASVLGLTPAETQLAQVLIDGKQLATAAAALGISRNTAKTQLASIFAKTGTNRQAQLVALLAALASGSGAR